MKKVLLLFTILVSCLSHAKADNSEWIFYVYESSAGKDIGTFQTTGTDNIFLLENAEISYSGSGFNFMIRNSSWGGYGWADGQPVATAGIEYTVATANNATGWATIPAGVYDITFNLANLTIKLDPKLQPVGTGTKKVSILGDSYSTIQGYLTPNTNAYWYTYGANPWHTTDVTTVSQTWWYQFITGGDYVLERNNSYSGSTMVNTPLEGMDVSTTFISRATNLGSPDVIFIFGGTNDTWNTALTMGDYKYSGWTDDDKKQFRPGFAYLLNHVKTSYPSAEIYFILNDILSSDINISVATICDYYSVPCIVTKNIGKSDYHPNAEGMTAIATQVKDIVESSDEGNDWYITGEFNSWVKTKTFVQSGSSDVFTLDDFTIALNKLDDYHGFSFQISNGTNAYSYSSGISESGIYSFENNTNEGAWTNAYWSEVSSCKKYCLTWNKRTHTLKIEQKAEDPIVVEPNNITYTTYADGHAVAKDYLCGADISMLNYVVDLGAKFYDANGTQKDALAIMKENGVNFARIRLYNNPGEEISYVGDDSNTYTYKLPAGYCDEDDVLNLARRAKAHGMKIELTFHYSDFWTNGSMQFKPKDWKNMTLEQLKTAIYDYTKAFLQRMNAQGTTPEYVSLGNEIESGFLFGYYNNMDGVRAAWDKPANQAALLGEASKAVREACPESKIIIHYTLSSTIGWSRYSTLLTNLKNNGYTDYDIVGASYYPYWTNQKPTMLTSLADNVYSNFGKELMVMEVGYSWTPYRPTGRNNGNYEGQLKRNGTAYDEASVEGQKRFMQEFQNVVKGNSHILGYIYWDPIMVDQYVGGKWIETAWAMKKNDKGEWWQDGNVVSNTTWFDYEGKALPVFEAIAEDHHTLPSTVTIDNKTYTVETESPLQLTIGSTGYATFYDVQAREIPDGLIVYTVQSYTGSKLDLTEYNGSNIPPATGVLVKGDEGTYYLWPRYDGSSSVSGNLLYGTASEQTITTPTGNYYYYKLAKDATNGLGWYWGAANGGVFTNGAHKAYLAVPQGQANARSFISIFSDESTDISSMHNSQCIMHNECFNLQGRRVGNPTKGLYIVGGKKIVIK